MRQSDRRPRPAARSAESPPRAPTVHAPTAAAQRERNASAEEHDGNCSGHNRPAHPAEKAAFLRGALDLRPAGRELRQHLGGRAIAPVRVMRERPGDDLLHVRRYILSQTADRLGRGAQNRAQHRDIVFPGKRPASGQHLVEHDAQRPHVGARVERIAARLLGRHVGDGAEDHPRARHVVLGRELGETEVQDLDDAVGRDNQVRGFDVAVDDVRLMGAREPCAVWIAMSSASAAASGPRSIRSLSVSPS